MVGRNKVERCIGQHEPNLEQATPSGKVAPADPADHERKLSETQIVEET